ncbi:hypothetical protein Dimus_034131 [Dionaea muscipula]
MQRVIQRLILISSTQSIKRHSSANLQLYSTTPDVYHQLNHTLQDSNLYGDLRTGKLAHGVLLKLGFHGYASSWNKLLKSYCLHGKFDDACNLFDNIPKRDVVTYNTVISVSIRNGNGHNAVHLFSVMKGEGIQPNHITLASLIGAVTLGGGMLHAQVIHFGLSWNQFVGSSLVDRYSKQGRLDDAIKAFEEITDQLDLVSWNIVIDGCAANKSKDNALRLFSQMLKLDFAFDGFTLTSVIKVCLEPRDLYCGRLLHSMAIKAGVLQETPLNNSLITMYSKCEEGMISAERIFRDTAEPNVISWTAMIAGFMQNGQSNEAIRVYTKMLEMGGEENDYSFASILPAYGSLANLGQGRKIHARIVKSWFGTDVSVNNALIDMYSRCGSMADAHSVFLAMEVHDVVSCTAMITCFGQHGCGKEAVAVLKSMIYKKRLVPDDISFLGCLSACSHSRLLDEGIGILQMMINVYGYRPKREHVSCVVDMLGRAGRLKDAEKFIYEMGIESDIVVWETLLAACNLHGEMELGEKSAKRIMELQPERHGTYVALANLYADRKLWKDKGMLRERLNKNSLNKEVGCSWVT